MRCFQSFLERRHYNSFYNLRRSWTTMTHLCTFRSRGWADLQTQLWWWTKWWWPLIAQVDMKANRLMRNRAFNRKENGLPSQEKRRKRSWNKRSYLSSKTIWAILNLKWRVNHLVRLVRAFIYGTSLRRFSTLKIHSFLTKPSNNWHSTARSCLWATTRAVFG